MTIVLCSLQYILASPLASAPPPAQPSPEGGVPLKAFSSTAHTEEDVCGKDDAGADIKCKATRRVATDTRVATAPLFLTNKTRILTKSW